MFPQDHFVGKRCIELGAGTGLISIVAALLGLFNQLFTEIWRNLIIGLGATVVATDLDKPTVQALLARNISINNINKVQILPHNWFV